MNIEDLARRAIESATDGTGGDAGAGDADGGGFAGLREKVRKGANRHKAETSGKAPGDERPAGADADASGGDGVDADGVDADGATAWKLPTKPLRLTREMCEPPGVVGIMSKYITDTSRCPRPAFSLCASVTLWGTLFGRWYESEERSGNRTNCYGVAVGESNAGKTEVLNKLINIMVRADALDLIESEITCDTAIHNALMENKWASKLFLIDECGEFLKGASASNKNQATGQATILEFFKKLYSSAGTTYVSKRKAKEPRVFIKDPQANICAATTPDRFARGMGPDEIEGGWIGRCLVFMEEGLVRDVDAPTIPYPEAMLAAIQRFAPVKGSEPPEPTTVYFTPGAKTLYRRFYDQLFDLREQLTKRRDPFRPIWGKVVENAKKLGLLYACSRSAEDGSKPTIDNAAAMWGCRVAYILAANLYLFASEHGGESEYAELKNWAYREIKATGTKGITPRELGRRRRSMKTIDRDEVLDDLREIGDIVDIDADAESNGKAGHPKGGRLVAACWLSDSAKLGKVFCPDVMGQNGFCPGQNTEGKG